MVELWRSWVISMVGATCLIVLFCFVGDFLLPNHGHCRRTGPKSTWSLLWVASARRRVPTRTSEVRALENGIKTEKFEEIHRYPCRNTETSHHLCHSLLIFYLFLQISCPSARPMSGDWIGCAGVFHWLCCRGRLLMSTCHVMLPPKCLSC